MAMGKGYRILHKLPPDRETPYSVMMESKAQEDTLMFESGAVVKLSPDESEPLRKQYTKILDAYGCLGAMCLNAGNEQVQFLVVVTSCLSVGKIGESEVFRITSVQFISLRNEPSDEDRISEVRKLLSSGVFYFTWKQGGNPWDLSLCAQRKLQDHDTDNRFFWNRMLHVHFQRYGIDCSTWLLKAMCGGVEMRTIYAGHRQAKACLISRLSCERAGTRFNVRGCNDDGNVANFVETEQVIFLDDQIASFVQTRGSVPLFWEQPGIQVGSHKVHMSRGYEMAAPAFDRHFRTVKKQYGDQVIVNLLGQREGEKMLSQAFMNHHSASVHSQDVPYYHFDYHSEIKGTNLKNLEKLKTRIMKHMTQFDFFYTEGEDIKHQQTGTIRTNCLDCLDRTNATQTMIGMELLHRQLEALGLASKPQMIGRFEEVYKQIWIHNGDHISRIYTGTGALGASESILQGMTQCYREYTRRETYRVCVGTYNVNGGKHYRSIAYKHQSLADWLLDAHKARPNDLVGGVNYEKPVDIFAVGFEEIVDLNASNIMSASTTNAREWQKEVLKTISREHKYVMLTSIQLVGVVLYIFIRPHLAPRIRDVAVDKVKTGLGGAAGNKGGVAIRFLLDSTSLCFVCAHLAAGHSQVKERNEDYAEITRKMAFPMGRTILSHDRVFWCGDFNYRIDLSNDEVKSLVSSENLGALQEMDQLNVQRGLGNTFQGFNEGELNFNPTYKYDTFSDDYDTSEKNRIPAWTDRVLWRVRPFSDTDAENAGESNSEVKLLLYSRAELRTSDHRPVLGLFDVQTIVVDEERKDPVLTRVVGQQGPPDGTVIVSDATQEGLDLSDACVNEVVERLNEVGDIVIVRFVGADMWILYQHGRFALEALQFDQQEFAGTVVRIRLKTTSWQAEIEKELNLCSSNTGPLYNQFTNSLLGDDFSVPSMEFDMEEDDADDLEVENALSCPLAPTSSSGANTPTGHASPALLPQGDIPGGPPIAPSRPARPPGLAKPMSAASGASCDGGAVSRENTPQLRASPNPDSRQPPARPSAPPAKPPPPQRPPGGPPRPSPPTAAQAASGPGGPARPAPASSASQAPKVREPLRPPPSDKSRSKKGARISSIGLPTNVSHQGHASSIEEAQALIERLMTSPASEGTTPTSGMPLPQPLLPSKSENNLSDASVDLTKTVSRSRTACDVRDTTESWSSEATSSSSLQQQQQQQQQPQPVPRRRSSDNNLVGMEGNAAVLESPPQPSASKPDPVAPVPVARPRPVPRRDVQSGVPALPNPPAPAVARRPGSVLVMPTPTTDNSSPTHAPSASRPAPPPPVAPRPAPLPPDSSAPVPPARGSRPAAKLPVHDGDRLPPTAPPVADETHLLDRTNSLVDDPPLSSEPDPFDTAFAKIAPVPLNSGSNPDPFSSAFGPSGLESSPHPFSTSSGPTNPLSSSDPFDTSFVTKPASLAPSFPSADANDPFDTSSIKPVSQTLPSSMPHIAFENNRPNGDNSIDNDPFHLPQNNGWDPFSTQSSQNVPNTPHSSHKDQSSLDSPRLQTDCPAEAPPPLPRNPTPVIGQVGSQGPPPVPSRGNIAPPPVPKRPS
ncbi:synaptojanin-1 [Elysia marginata]|uniref:phosphoinositide 5-phosphatase n=1 Tax=Elysia marginata TaxID=1093978 RepID=A0AAV4G0J6_9GAST|nr:synaptojanin-1 [Elysia marginata]